MARHPQDEMNNSAMMNLNVASLSRLSWAEHEAQAPQEYRSKGTAGAIEEAAKTAVN
jgi:hypothetical protein